MYQVKNSIFLDLTKNQKSDFLSFVKIYTKNYFTCDEQSIFYNLIDEIEYFHKQNLGRFDYIDINSEKHLEDIKKYIHACKVYYEYKASQHKLYEEQKRVQKEIKSKIVEAKQKKEPATKKQVSYYQNLCRRYSLNPKDINSLSKYDIKMEISRILQEAEKNRHELVGE